MQTKYDDFDKAITTSFKSKDHGLKKGTIKPQLFVLQLWYGKVFWSWVGLIWQSSYWYAGSYCYYFNI